MNTSTITGLNMEPPAAQATHTRSIEDPNQPITYAMLAELLSGGPTPSGETVTPRSSMKIGAVWACVQVISRAIARMPLITYEKAKEGRVRAEEHELFPLLKMRPNPDMSAFVFMQTLVANTLLYGGGFAEIVRRRNGRVQELVPIESDRVTPFRVSGEVRYRVQTDNGPITLLKRDMLHIPGMSFDGLNGLSVIGHARTLLGASMSRDKFSASFYKNGCRPSGVLEHPGKIGDKAVATLRASLEQLLSGPTNAGKPLVLEEGMKWSSSIIPQHDAQYVETHYAGVEDVCRLFNVPPHKVQHLLRATNNNIEQQSLDFLSDTIAPWAEAIEQEVNFKLLTDDERRTHYAEFLTQAIVQMDSNARGQLYERLFRVGAISPDEIRQRENMNDLPDGRGRTYWTQSSNMPLPTEEQTGRLVEAFITKGTTKPPGGAGGPDDDSGSPKSKKDDAVASGG